METEQTQKKPRSLPRVWASFWSLKRGDKFTLGVETFTKTRPLVQRFHRLRAGATWVFPWTRVRTTTLVRDVLKGGATSGAAAELNYKNEGVRTARLNDRSNVKTPQEIFGRNSLVPGLDHQETLGGATLTTGPVFCSNPNATIGGALHETTGPNS